MKISIKFIFICISTVAFSQNATVLYKLKKGCNEIFIGRIVDEKYYHGYTTLLKNNKEHSTDGKFLLNSNKQFPLPYSFTCGHEDGSFVPSSLFTVSKEDLNFKLDSIGMLVQPMPVNNKKSVLIQDQYKFNAQFSSLLNVFANKKEDQLKLDRLLIQYSKKNPKSYMLFWTLVNQFQFTGPRESYLKAMKNLTPCIRNSEYGKIFQNDITNSFKLSEQSIFPNMEFQENKILSSLGKKYTLIDFWFSYCKPCLEELPDYKKMYQKYKDKGFEMISVSTDRTEDKNKLTEVIKGKELGWVHYWDENGKTATFYNINTYPTHFLLDAKGTIIKKNFSTEELDAFLEENLK